MFLIGCHLSVSKGYYAMGKDAVSVGANTFQFFSRNPRGGKARAADPDDASGLRSLMSEKGMGPIIAHAPYTLNPCAADERVREFAREAMAEDLDRLERYLPGNLYNFHPGSHVGQGVERGIQIIAETVNSVLKPGLSTVVLLETMAGKGSEVGGRFEEIRDVWDRITLRESVGVCLDVCHVYDAGYDIVQDLDGVLTSFDRIIGLDKLRAVHLNDSKNPFASHKDRHEAIGEGTIGIEAVSRIINHPAFRGLPFVLETPNELAGHGEEIALLRSLYHE